MEGSASDKGKGKEVLVVEEEEDPILDPSLVLDEEMRARRQNMVIQGLELSKEGYTLPQQKILGGGFPKKFVVKDVKFEDAEEFRKIVEIEIEGGSRIITLKKKTDDVEMEKSKLRLKNLAKKLGGYLKKKWGNNS